jgi:hypothetical protein
MLSELTKYGGRNLLFLQKLGSNSLHILTAQEPLNTLHPEVEIDIITYIFMLHLLTQTSFTYAKVWPPTVICNIEYVNLSHKFAALV